MGNSETWIDYANTVKLIGFQLNASNKTALNIVEMVSMPHLNCRCREFLQAQVLESGTFRTPQVAAKSS